MVQKTLPTENRSSTLTPLQPDWARMDWRELLRASVRTPEALADIIGGDVDELRKVHAAFPLCINPYYLSLIRYPGDPIWRQAIPDARELTSTGMIDPLGEEKTSPVRCICHRYPDRVLLYVSARCAMFCRFCTRKRKVGDPQSVNWDDIQAGIDYIGQHEEVRDVVVSGGDPFLLEDSRLERILIALRAIPHVEIIRIGTRVPVTLPQRITRKLCDLLRRFHPLYINTHFNHSWEITPHSRWACTMLADAGIPLGNQTVLLKGVNDTPEVMKELMQKLLTLRVKPYYIYQADLVQGTDHFRTSVKQGLEIMAALRGYTSGLAVPHYVIDAPGGGGKIAVIPDPVVSRDENEICLRNFEGALFRYPASGGAEGAVGSV